MSPGIILPHLFPAQGTVFDKHLWFMLQRTQGKEEIVQTLWPFDNSVMKWLKTICSLYVIIYLMHQKYRGTRKFDRWKVTLWFHASLIFFNAGGNIILGNGYGISVLLRLTDIFGWSMYNHTLFFARLKKKRTNVRASNHHRLLARGLRLCFVFFHGVI